MSTISSSSGALVDVTVPFSLETRVFLQGVNLDGRNDSSLYELIAMAEAHIKELEKVEHRPVKLDNKIRELRDGIAALVTYIDNR